jgi:hypothetical protein
MFLAYQTSFGLNTALSQVSVLALMGTDFPWEQWEHWEQ